MNDVKRRSEGSGEGTGGAADGGRDRAIHLQMRGLDGKHDRLKRERGLQVVEHDAQGHLVGRERNSADLFGFKQLDAAGFLAEVGGVHDHQMRRREFIDLAGEVFRRGVTAEKAEGWRKAGG